MQVVYILVEIRKLLEHDIQKDTYPVLNFYGNWVVHTKLSASPVADRIVRLLDEVMYRKATDTIDLAVEDEAVAFFDEEKLRTEMSGCLLATGLPTDLCANDKRWYDFRKSLAGVIEDAALELRPSKTSSPTHFIESVIVKNKSTEDALHVEWQYILHSYPIIEIKDSRMSLKATQPAKP